MNEEEYLHMYAEEEHHWWYAGMREIALSLLPPASVTPGRQVLDVGCGTGYNLSWLKAKYRVCPVGIDISAHGLMFSRQRHQKDLVRGDAAALPFKGDSFELVTSLDVVSQMEGAGSRASALREFLRVLRPGGRLVIRVPAFEWLRSSHDEQIRITHRYRKQELLDLIAAAGFCPLRITAANSLLFPVAVVWRLLKKAGLAASGSDVRSHSRGSNRMNSLLTSLLRLEARWLCRPGARLPIGLSLILVAGKPDFGEVDKGRSLPYNSRI
jgi:SAM-dependent methyltransferase